MCLGVPGLIEEITGEGLFRSSRVSFSGVSRQVSLAFLPEAQVGDHVIVHVGVAISILQPERASQVQETLRQAMKKPNPRTLEKDR